MPSALETFAANLRRARLAADISQEEVALRIGTDVSNISRYETAGRDPSVTMVVRLAAAVGVPAATLLAGADAADPDR
jgi:transcriptional regulator with XRE-family HTH domain